MTDDYSDRHPATQQIMRWFAYDHLPEGLIRDTSITCWNTACIMVDNLPDDPELVTGLRKLLEAKDAFVRTAVAAGKATP